MQRLIFSLFFPATWTGGENRRVGEFSAGLGDYGQPHEVEYIIYPKCPR